MTSTSIYTPITPTYLYIKQHFITGLKYFGKTTNLDPYKYNGSGKHWTRHIKKHGKEHIVTLWVSDLYYDTSIIDVALKFSMDNDIVNSKEWANLIPENGLDGGSKTGKTGKPHTEETKAKMKGRLSPNKGKLHTDEAKAKMSVAQKGKVLSKETKLKMSISRKGEPKSEKTKAKMSDSHKGKSQKQVVCPYCGKTGGKSAMKRYHFDKCKAKITEVLSKH